MTDKSSKMSDRRVVPLEGGSNFRDIGGYRSADGRSVRWRHLFRSGAMGKLTERDIETLDGLDMRAIIDLRCKEERELAPGRWTQPQMHVVEYPMEAVFGKALGSEALQLYDAFPRLLSPHMRLVFNAMRDEATPVVVHCSGGQDRTGVVMGVVLAALGVSLEQIAEEYMRTTALRRRENEVDLQRVRDLAGSNPVAAFYAKILDERGPQALDPRPLLDQQGRPKIMLAFDAIDKQWGGMDRFLDSEFGLDDRNLAVVRDKYLEE